MNCSDFHFVCIIFQLSPSVYYVKYCVIYSWGLISVSRYFWKNCGRGSQEGEYQFRCCTLKREKYLRPIKGLRMNEWPELLRSLHSFMLFMLHLAIAGLLSSLYLHRNTNILLYVCCPQSSFDLFGCISLCWTLQKKKENRTVKLSRTQWNYFL